MPDSIYIEVEENPNSDYMPLMLYEAHSDPVPVSRVDLDEPDRPAGVYDVTGWCSEGGGSPCAALYAPVSDSGQAVVHLIYGGDWGVRFRPENSDEPWDIDSDAQFGEPYVMLLDGGAILS